MTDATGLPYYPPFRYTRPSQDLRAMFGAQVGNPPILPAEKEAGKQRPAKPRPTTRKKATPPAKAVNKAAPKQKAASKPRPKAR